MRIHLMKENEFSRIGKIATGLMVFALALVALLNIWRGDVARPGLFVITIAGFLLFLAAKLSVISRVRPSSFGTKFMTPAMANAYRVGYWLMLVGILATFV